MAEYAATTEVPVSKTRAEIETILERAGVSETSFHKTATLASIGFVLGNRMYRLELPLPDPAEERFWRTHHVRPRQATEEQAMKAWEQACRARWRALYLIIKAKMEAVAIGITTIEQEFLGATVLDNGMVFSQVAIPALESGKGTYLALTVGK